jgi:hypothetical protein
VLKDGDDDVRFPAAEASVAQSNLPEAAVAALVALLKDANGEFRGAESLRRQSDLPEATVTALVALRRDRDRDVRRYAAELSCVLWFQLTVGTGRSWRWLSAPERRIW